jgi:hypothetical protein
MPAPSDTAFEVFMAVLGLYFAGQLLWSIRGIRKLPKRKREKRDHRDVRLLWSSYRAARLNGASITDSLQFADDNVREFQQTGVIPILVPPGAAAIAEPRAPAASRVLGMSQAILINAVTVVGVFGMRWPVGTALALYWSETVVATLLLLLLVGLWRYGRPVETRGGSVGEVLLASAIFAAAHFVFLFFLISVILPRYSPAERFDRAAFEQGLLWIGVILLADFAMSAIVIRRRTGQDLQRRAQLQLQRTGVMHLSIVFGMFALALFGSPRALFAVFAALKALVDLTRRV